MRQGIFERCLGSIVGAERLPINLSPGNPPHFGTLTGQEVW
jgi:hypothetical protein